MTSSEYVVEELKTVLEINKLLVSKVLKLTNDLKTEKAFNIKQSNMINELKRRIT